MIDLTQICCRDRDFFNRAAKNPGKSGGEQNIEKRYRQSHSVYLRRLRQKPRVDYPDSLPVTAAAAAIKDAVSRHQVVIVCGETGSGKTTQLPKICLDSDRGVAGLIGHTQPRRLAAKAVAARIAAELGSPLGTAVGYKVRFDDKTTADTYIKLMTDGILLAEIQHDRFLRSYDTLIIDEAHERSLTIDFLLGYLQKIRRQRPDLKIIITSATLNAAVFCRQFPDAAVVNVPGRTYPVEVRYLPPASINQEQTDLTLPAMILQGIEELRGQAPGDILVFLPGEREIKDSQTYLRQYLHSDIEILPLYSGLPAANQQKIFYPAKNACRRVILATNIAETSLTVPGIKYVIDSGLAKIKRFSPRLKVEQLGTEKIAQASCRQRAGRCGRESAGICLRLYSQADYDSRAEFTDPELLRSNLAHVILLMKFLKLGDIASFPFIDAPELKFIKAGLQSLHELEALDTREQLTAAGRKMAQIPLDPRFAKMVLKAHAYACVPEVLIIVTALSIQDPRQRPLKFKNSTDNPQKIFTDPDSDFSTYLNLWYFFYGNKAPPRSNKELAALCGRYHLSYLRLREWRDLYQQLQRQLSAINFWQEQSSPSLSDRGTTAVVANERVIANGYIHRAVLSGLLTNIGQKSPERQEYIGVRGNHFTIFPASAVAKKPPPWIMAAELVATGKLYARQVAKITPEWLETEARHLLKYHYSVPHWSQARGEIIAHEKVTLFGLTIIAQRNVSFGRINPPLAREIFIREALTTGELNLNAPFYRQNKVIIGKIQEKANQLRRLDFVIEDLLCDFYDGVIPAGCYSLAALKKWLAEDKIEHNRQLTLEAQQLLKAQNQADTVTLFPRFLKIEKLSLPLTYRFEPGHPLDGVTLRLQLPLLPKLNDEQLQWLVPGMIREKIQLLLKNLPKDTRKQCLPFPQFITEFLSIPPDTKKALLPQLAEYITRKSGTGTIFNQESIHNWQAHSLPPHCYFNIQVINDKGEELAVSRNLGQLKRDWALPAVKNFQNYAADYERVDIKEWDIGDISNEVAASRLGKLISGHLALNFNQEQQRIDLKVYPTAAAAALAHREGVLALTRLYFKEQIKDLNRDLSRNAPVLLSFYPQINKDELAEDFSEAVCRTAFTDTVNLPYNSAAFYRHIAAAKKRWPEIKTALQQNLTAVAAAYSSLSKKIAGHVLAANLSSWLNNLIYPGFLTATPPAQRLRLPLYLQAAQLRINKFSGHGDKDRRYEAELNFLESRRQNYMQKLSGENKEINADLVHYRWLLEELRISFFAQELKTAVPVSVTRLNKIWDEILKI